MVLFIDTNVLIDFLAKRDAFQTAVDRVFDLILSGEAKGILASHSIANIWYILRKDFSPEERRELLLALLVYFDVVALNKEKLIQGLYRKDFFDYEDCLQEECACSAKADYIVTRNKKDFFQSRVTVVTPEELVALAP